MKTEQHRGAGSGLLDRDELEAFGDIEGVHYAEVVRDIGAEGASEIFDPFVEFEYRRRIGNVSATLPGGLPPTDLPTLLRDVIGAYKPLAAAIDNQRGLWKRNTQRAIAGNLRRGESTRQAVISASTEYADARGLSWRPGDVEIPRDVSAWVARKTGVSASQVRRILKTLAI